VADGLFQGKSDKMSQHFRLSVAVPLYNEESVLPECLHRTRVVLDGVAGGPHEMVLVDDGSVDRTLAILEAEAALDPRIMVVALSRNFGHQADPTAAVRHGLALLAPTGMLLVTVPAFTALWTNHDLVNEHVTRYTRRTFREMARQAGLDIEEERYFFQWLYPLKLATRVLERAINLQPRPASVPPGWINTPLYLPHSSSRTPGARFPGPIVA
jgi:hypothetical protein